MNKLSTPPSTGWIAPRAQLGTVTLRHWYHLQFGQLHMIVGLGGTIWTVMAVPSCCAELVSETMDFNREGCCFCVDGQHFQARLAGLACSITGAGWAELGKIDEWYADFVMAEQGGDALELVLEAQALREELERVKNLCISVKAAEGSEDWTELRARLMAEFNAGAVR